MFLPYCPLKIEKVSKLRKQVMKESKVKGRHCLGEVKLPFFHNFFILAVGFLVFSLHHNAWF